MDAQLFEFSLPHDAAPDSDDIGLDEEQVQADDAAMVVIEQDAADGLTTPKDSDVMDVVDLFFDGEDASMMDPVHDSSMVDVLRGAGVLPAYAPEASKRLCNLKPPATFMEIYGKSISDYAGAHRRDLNVQGLGAFDLRTLKSDGTPWDFTSHADRKLARHLVNQLNPDWIIGALPCTACCIWNVGLNFKKTNPEKVRAMAEQSYT